MPKYEITTTRPLCFLEKVEIEQEYCVKITEIDESVPASELKPGQKFRFAYRKDGPFAVPTDYSKQHLCVEPSPAILTWGYKDKTFWLDSEDHSVFVFDEEDRVIVIE